MPAADPATFRQSAPRTLLAALTVLVALPLIQLIPIPMSLWEYLPGRRYYAEAMSGVGVTQDFRVASLLRNVTEAAWLTLLVPIAVFLATLATDQQRLKYLVNLFIGLALLQAIIGLAQFGTGSLSVLWPEPGARFASVSANGTYANSNHLAGLLEMALPVVLGLLIAHLQLGGGKNSTLSSNQASGNASPACSAAGSASIWLRSTLLPAWGFFLVLFSAAHAPALRWPCWGFS